MNGSAEYQRKGGLQRLMPGIARNERLEAVHEKEVLVASNGVVCTTFRQA